MNKFTKTAIALATITLSDSAFADNTTGNVSNGNASTVKSVEVGDANTGKPDWDGKAGINIVYPGAEENSINNKFQSFEKIASMTKRPFTKRVITKTNDDVYVARMYNMSEFMGNVMTFVPEHRDAGRMSFKQAGTADVWFGDWEDVPRNSNNPEAEATKYTVYYAGANQSTTLPTDKVTYAVTGINKHRNRHAKVLTGTLTADFGNAKSVKGSISRSDLTIGVDANIRGANFNGTATANGARGGKSEGKFYGHKADTMAGMATFRRDHSKDTAFGGKKN